MLQIQLKFFWAFYASIGGSISAIKTQAPSVDSSVFTSTEHGSYNPYKCESTDLDHILHYENSDELI